MSSADILDVMLANTTSLSYSLQLPGQSSLSGASLFVQYAAFAPGINALGFVTSNGLELVLGDV